MQRQFVRTPYTVSFQAREKAFTLVTLHVIYGTQSTPEVRTSEIARFAQWLREHAEDPDEFNRNMMALGDFNIDKLDDADCVPSSSTAACHRRRSCSTSRARSARRRTSTRSTTRSRGSTRAAAQR
jgi:exonuclease III